MSVQSVRTNSKSYDAGAPALPAVQSQQTTSATSPDQTAAKPSEQERNAKTQESRLAGDAMRAKLDGAVDSIYEESNTSLIASSDPRKPLPNGSQASAKLKELASSDPAAYKAITDSLPNLNDNKKRALIQVIMTPGSTPQSMQVAAESLAGLPEKAKVTSNGERYTGVQFEGDDPTLAYLQKKKDEGKLSQNEFDVFASISKNEGQLNAINTRDNQVVSFGFRQNSANGQLQPLLKAVKDQNPEKFKEYFEDKGISLTEENGKAIMKYKSPASGKEYNFPNDIKKPVPLEDRLHLAKVFHQASQNPEVSEILKTAQIPSARKSLNAAMNTTVPGGTVANFVQSNRGKAYINDSFNHLSGPAQDQFKKAALDVYSKHGFDTSDSKKLNRDQLFDKVAQELYQKNHPGEQLPADKAKEYKNLAQRQIEEEFIQKTKDLRMDFFKENEPLRLSEMERRYQNIEQYFQTQRAAKAKTPDSGNNT
jgi:hypothetical protein